MKRLVLVLVVGLAMMSCDSRSAQEHRKAQMEHGKEQVRLKKEEAKQASKSHALETLAQYGTIIVDSTTLNYNPKEYSLVSDELSALAVLSEGMDSVFINRAEK
jgi:hypothetical protein